MNILIIGMLIALILVGAGCVIADKGRIEDETWAKVLGIVLIVMGFIIVFISLKTYMDNQKESFQNSINAVQEELDKKLLELELAQEMIENGANVYIDGQLIDSSKIILEHYNVTIIDDYIILND